MLQNIVCLWSQFCFTDALKINIHLHTGKKLRRVYIKMLILITRCCAYRTLLSLCVWVLFRNSQVFYNYFYNQKKKYADWTNEEGKKRTLILWTDLNRRAANPNARTRTSIFPNDIINVIHFKNQIVKGSLKFGKIKTNSEDWASGSSLQNSNRDICLVLSHSHSQVGPPHLCARQKGQGLRKKGLKSMQRSPWDSTHPTPTPLLATSTFRKYFLNSSLQEKKEPFFLWHSLATYGTAMNRGFYETGFRYHSHGYATDHKQQ